jgi:hypothetical protein
MRPKSENDIFILYVRNWQGLIGAWSCRFNDISRRPWCDLHSQSSMIEVTVPELPCSSFLVWSLAVSLLALFVVNSGGNHSQCAKTAPQPRFVCFRLTQEFRTRPSRSAKQHQWSPAPAPAPVESGSSTATPPSFSFLPVSNPWSGPQSRRTWRRQTYRPRVPIGPKQIYSSLIRQCWWRARVHYGSAPAGLCTLFRHSLPRRILTFWGRCIRVGIARCHGCLTAIVLFLLLRKTLDSIWYISRKIIASKKRTNWHKMTSKT